MRRASSLLRATIAVGLLVCLATGILWFSDPAIPKTADNDLLVSTLRKVTALGTARIRDSIENTLAHRTNVFVFSDLSSFWMRFGAFAQAEAVLQNDLDSMRGLISAESPNLFAALYAARSTKMQKAPKPQVLYFCREWISLRPMPQLPTRDALIKAHQLLAYAQWEQSNSRSAETNLLLAADLEQDCLKRDSHNFSFNGDETYKALGELYAEVGRLDDAELAFLRVIARRGCGYGRYGLYEAAPFCDRVGDFLMQRGKFSQAEQLYRNAMAMRITMLQPDSPVLIGSLRSIADACRAQGKHDEASALDARADQIWHSIIVSPDPNRGWNLLSLAAHYFLRGKFSEATSIMGTSVRLLKRRLPNSDERLQEQQSHYYKWLARANNMPKHAVWRVHPFRSLLED